MIPPTVTAQEKKLTVRGGKPVMYDSEEVKAALNHRVRWNSPRCRIDAEYILTACIIRRTDSRFFYQSELQDLKNQKSVCIVRLDEIERV